MARDTGPTKVHPPGNFTSLAISLPIGTSPNMAQMESITMSAVESFGNDKHTGVQVNGRDNERRAIERITVSVSVPSLYVFESMMLPWYIRPGSAPCS